MPVLLKLVPLLLKLTLALLKLKPGLLELVPVVLEFVPVLLEVTAVFLELVATRLEFVPVLLRLDEASGGRSVLGLADEAIMLDLWQSDRGETRMRIRQERQAKKPIYGDFPQAHKDRRVLVYPYFLAPKLGVLPPMRLKCVSFPIETHIGQGILGEERIVP